MFETAVLSYGTPSKRVWATALGFTGQALLIGTALLIPLVSPQTLGRAVWITSIAPPGAPPPPPTRNEVRVVPTGAKRIDSQVTRGGISLPRNIPAVAAQIIDKEPPSAPTYIAGVPGGIGSGSKDGIPGGLGIGLPAALPTPVERPPEPKPVPAVKPPESVKPPRITVLRMATPIHRVDPIYPRIAIQAHISGSVELMGVLGVDGRIHELKVLRGHPLLIKAAMDAVLQWVYEPTLLNGQPVEVAAPITVNFILN